MKYGVLQKLSGLALAFSMVACAPVQDAANQQMKQCLVSRLGGAKTPFYINVFADGEAEIVDERSVFKKKKEFPTPKDIEKAKRACLPLKKSFILG